jgi:thioredoxin 2
VVEALGRSHAGRLKIVKLDIEAAPAIAQRHGVMSIPTLLLLRAGQEVDRVVGALPEPALRAWLDERLAAAAAPGPAQSGATSP